MRNFVNVALRNSTNSQHLYHATDDVLGQPVLRDTPLAPSDPATAIALGGDENGVWKNDTASEGESIRAERM